MHKNPYSSNKLWLQDLQEELIFKNKTAQEVLTKHELNTFGSFVADNIRKLKPINQILAKRKITNLLMDLQMSEIKEI